MNIQSTRTREVGVYVGDKMLFIQIVLIMVLDSGWEGKNAIYK